MNHYQVVLNGTNFLVRLDGKKKLMGFYTTRFVTATDPDDAEAIAVQGIENDDELQRIVLDESSHPSPTVSLEEMYEITEGEMADDYGFGWYEMSDEE